MTSRATGCEAHTADGDPLFDQEWCGPADLVFPLRAAGYVDAGTPGTPVFRADRPSGGTGERAAGERRGWHGREETPRAG